MEDEKRPRTEDGAPLPESPAVQPEKAFEEAHLPTSEPPEQDQAMTGQETKEEEWVTGLKLGVIVAAITMAAFLMLLDVSIVATVSPLHVPS